MCLGSRSSNLLPVNQLRNIAGLSDEQLHGASYVSRFTDARDPKYRVLEYHQSSNLLKLLGRKPERGLHVIQAVERKIVGRSIDAIWTLSQFEKAIDQIIAHARQRAQHVPRCPGKINGTGAVDREIIVPARTRSECFPSMDLLEFIRGAEQGVRRTVIVGFRRRVQPMEPGIWFHPIQQRIDHRITLIEINALEFEISAQNIQTHRIFASSQPVQIQTAALADNAGLIT